MKRILLILCLLGLFPMISMPAQEAKEPVPTFSREHFEIEGHKAFVILPATERTNKGIAIAGVDVGESYGSPDGRSIYDALHKTLVDKYRFDHKACLLARSRGGLMLYCWAVENPEKVRCIAGIYPVCDLTSYPGISKACAAYGMTKAELEASLDQHNPIPRLAALAKAQVPIFHIHGDKDKVVPLEANSAALQKVYQKLGGSIQLVIAPDQWHNMWRGFFECQELVDFVITKAIGV